MSLKLFKESINCFVVLELLYPLVPSVGQLPYEELIQFITVAITQSDIHRSNQTGVRKDVVDQVIRRSGRTDRGTSIEDGYLGTSSSPRGDKQVEQAVPVVIPVFSKTPARAKLLGSTNVETICPDAS